MRRETTDSPALVGPEPGHRFILLFFNEANQIWLRRTDSGRREWTVAGPGSEGPLGRETAPPSFGSAVTQEPLFWVSSAGESRVPVFFGRAASDRIELEEDPNDGFWSVEELRAALATRPKDFSADIHAVMEAIKPHLVRIPYLEKGEHDFIYRFRPEKLRNRAVYEIDQRSAALYQSGLCRAIKAVKRINERSSTTPTRLDFGAVSYVLPSHFGFCLGVQNAIERAYESIAENPGRTVYMLSELIHNPFVNQDLQARGLRYLQTDQGKPLSDPDSGDLLWDRLGKDDVVIIPAFGATDEDKVRLIEKGIAINRYDATCMLVEKVWKAARRFGREGYTVIIHGKAEHEETKATFSNAAKAGAALIVRNQEEAELLGAIISANHAEEKQRLFRAFARRHTNGFDPVRDLDRLAVVNQTTLLRNETLRIIEYLEEVVARKFGPDQVERHINGSSKGDTLCYATQVNQDALQKALDLDLDFALVAGGGNSSNTYQLFRLCQERLGARAFYIQSEKNILSPERILHYNFGPGDHSDPAARLTECPFLDLSANPIRILLTGGASCPDGIIQQIIARVNSFFPPSRIRSMEEVLSDLNEVL